MSNRRWIVSVFWLIAVLAAVPANAATTEQMPNDSGLVRFYRGEYAEALADFDRALAINPRFAEAHYNAGRCLQKMGDLKGAIARFEAALAITPNYPAVLGSLAKAKKALGVEQEKEAKAGTRFRVKISPELSYPYDDFTEAFYQVYANKTDRAAELYRSMEKSDPKSIRPSLERGIVYYELKMFAEAADLFRVAVQLEPDNIHALYDEGLALEMKGDREAAADLYRAATDKNPAFRKAGDRLSALEASLSSDDYEAARRAYERQDWKTATERIDSALRHASPGSSDEADMRNLKALATTAMTVQSNRKGSIRQSFLAKNYSYDDVYERGMVRQVGVDLIWTGLIRKIHRRGRETVIVAIQSTDRSGITESSTTTGDVKYFQIHCGRTLSPDPRLDEEAFVEVYGRLTGAEDMIDGYKYGCASPIPALSAHKLTITKDNVAGSLVIEPLN